MFSFKKKLHTLNEFLKNESYQQKTKNQRKNELKFQNICQFEYHLSLGKLSSRWEMDVLKETQFFLLITDSNF